MTKESITEKIEKRAAAIEVRRYAKTVKALGITGIVGMFLALFAAVTPGALGFYLRFAILIGMVGYFGYYTFRSNGEIKRLESTYNIDPRSK